MSSATLVPGSIRAERSLGHVQGWTRWAKQAYQRQQRQTARRMLHTDIAQATTPEATDTGSTVLVVRLERIRAATTVTMDDRDARWAHTAVLCVLNDGTRIWID